MFPCPKSQSVDYGSYVNDLVENIQSAHDGARRNLKTSLKRMKKNYDLKILLRPHAEGDVVYLLDTAVSKGQSRKLSSPCNGPTIIIKKLSSYIYRVKLHKSVFVVNHDRLMPCRDRTLPKWITEHESLHKDSAIIPDSEEGTKYCLCRQPWNGRFMIQCDYCDEWFYSSCVNISVSDALTIDKYKCKACKGGGAVSISY